MQIAEIDHVDADIRSDLFGNGTRHDDAAG